MGVCPPMWVTSLRSGTHWLGKRHNVWALLIISAQTTAPAKTLSCFTCLDPKNIPSWHLDLYEFLKTKPKTASLRGIMGSYNVTDYFQPWYSEAKLCYTSHPGLHTVCVELVMDSPELMATLAYASFIFWHISQTYILINFLPNFFKRYLCKR